MKTLLIFSLIGIGAAFGLAPQGAPPVDSDASTAIFCATPKHKETAPQLISVSLKVKDKKGKVLQETGITPVDVYIPMGATAKQKATLIRTELDAQISWPEITFTNGTPAVPSAIISIDAASGAAGEEVKIIKATLDPDKTKEANKVEDSANSLVPVDVEYVYTPNANYVGLYQVGEVPHGMVFKIYGTPAAVNPDDPQEDPYVGFMIGGVIAKATITSSDTVLSIATKLKLQFNAQGVTCTIINGGAVMICESPDGEEVHSHGFDCADEGIWVGAEFLKD